MASLIIRGTNGTVVFVQTVESHLLIFASLPENHALIFRRSKEVGCIHEHIVLRFDFCDLEPDRVIHYHEYNSNKLN
jgi:hypothetical protein